jgi:exopolysaccharide production protein ExoQ
MGQSVFRPALDHCSAMPPPVATLIFVIGIAGLFWLDRDPETRVSKAFWIPTAWLLITCSRPVSMWLGMTPAADTASVLFEGSPVDRAVFMVLVVAGLMVVISRREQVKPILRKNWPIVLFFSYAASSMLWSDYPLVTFKHWIKGIGEVLMVLIVLTEPSVSDAIRRLVTRVGFVLLPLSVLFIKYYPELGRWYDPWTGTAMYSGVAIQKNSLGGLCLAIGLGLLWRSRAAYNDREDPARRRRLLALGVVLGMAFWLLWLCNSMTSISGLALASAVMLLSTRPAFRWRPALVHVLVVALLAIPLYALFFQSSGALVEDLGRKPTLSGRTEIWSAVLSVPVSRLVGAGYESFWLGQRLEELWSHFSTLHINEAHNGYIEILLNLGWIGVGLLAVIIAVGYRRATAALSWGPDVASLSLAWLLAGVIRGLTEAAFRMLSTSWIFFLLAVMTASQATPSPGDIAAELGSFGECQAEAEPALELR